MLRTLLKVSLLGLLGAGVLLWLEAPPRGAAALDDDQTLHLLMAARGDR